VHSKRKWLLTLILRNNFMSAMPSKNHSLLII
jgi:hypothetical protein